MNYYEFLEAISPCNELELHLEATGWAHIRGYFQHGDEHYFDSYRINHTVRIAKPDHDYETDYNEVYEAVSLLRKWQLEPFKPLTVEYINKHKLL